MDKGCNRPEGLNCLNLILLANQTFHHKLLNIRFKAIPKKSFVTLWYVFKNLEGPPKGEVCNSRRIFCLSWEFLERYKRSLYHNESFFQLNVSFVLESCCNFRISSHTSSSFFHSSLASFIQSGWIIEMRTTMLPHPHPFLRVHLPPHFVSLFI